ncbi:acyloxyacyl hydrolase [Aquimarina pacifica]|uniref:acyloxyacyl hydrolase n=1 Tax=Aquimarina pacifica TaxID=1296415 RepID=UPI0004707779|nr:acyloxyacyl hydrolase [Aquimarina pacifica]
MPKIRFYSIIFFVGLQVYAQQLDTKTKNSLFIAPEFLFGKTMEANTGFPETKLQKSLFVSLGVNNQRIDEQWSSRFGIPKTGISLGVTDFGNIDKVGIAYTLLPFLEVGLFSKKTNRLHLNTGFGASYIDTKYNMDTNPFNKGITTSFNWSFKSFIYYDVLVKKSSQWRLGLGYTHHSNGHTLLPNQGLNSFSVSASSLLGNTSYLSPENQSVVQNTRVKSSQTYFSFRSGIGQNVLSEVYNDKKEVYSFAMSMGKVINKIFKLGVGFYGRFYEQYYDYIKNEGDLVKEQVPFFIEKPIVYASNYGFFVSSEVFMGHVGIEFDMGLNVYKPFYKIDWQLSQGELLYTGEYVLGELDWYYEVKRTISSRLGVKCYLLNTYKSPKNNFFVGASINANLGQADFSELNFGYVYRFSKKSK